MLCRGLQERDAGTSSPRLSRPSSGAPELGADLRVRPGHQRRGGWSAVKSDNVWTEWEMRGTRRDGRSHWTRGVIVFGVSGDAIHWARFYVEPVDESDKTVDDAIREQVVRQ